MNEDEAFIRAIVDSPGDDLPRLVYADWLDDRADPRGPYLRAEMAWARTGNKVKALRKLGELLDPVWVYRVSRPPIGVCLTKDIFSKCGPLLDGELEVETRNQLKKFPPEYVAFLLNYNGGDLLDDVRDTLSQLDCSAARFAALGTHDSDGELLTPKQLSAELTHPNGSDRVLTNCIPIAYARGEFDAYNCLLLQPPLRGKKLPHAVIYYTNPCGQEWSEEDVDSLQDDDEDEGDDEEQDDEDERDRRDRLWTSMDVTNFQQTIAPSLPAFLAML